MLFKKFNVKHTRAHIWSQFLKSFSSNETECTKKFQGISYKTEHIIVLGGGESKMTIFSLTHRHEL